jgi:hypothetical protein
MKRVLVSQDLLSVRDADKFSLEGWSTFVEESELIKIQKVIRLYELFLKACEGEDTAIDLLGIRNFAHPHGVKKVRQMITDASKP